MKKNPNLRPQLKAHEAVVAKLDKLVAKWVGDLWLGQWQIDTSWRWNGIDSHDDRTIVYAECDADWRYMRATIRFNVPACSTLSDRLLEEKVVHELLHCVVNEMRETEIKHEERVVSHLQRIACYLACRKAK